ncbi:hypothetical protein CTEN210_11130 [Chaetoceros tenuissimus]|uniref:Integrase catalytic domain-containing protein n=1 Tax=Chaetoceros tenuissimus TaxID=426638 RepID=A0AAD3CZ64_9STRA|nr:hypothetical protein CTEN210_11130 [Chaetoceros tenuissimus]
MSQQIDYTKLYFPVKTATPIVGQPTIDSIANLKKELTKNAKSVTSTLGGAQHGHIFLVLTATDFNAIPGTVPVIRPVHPGPLPQIPVGATAAQISAAERNHQEAVNNFDRYTGVELALLAQNHAEAGERQNVPVTEAWKIDKVLYLLTKTGKFTEDIKQWKKKPQQDKTWVNLVNYFNECHRLLLESNVLTIQDQERQQLSANLASTFEQALALQANSSNTDVASSLAEILRHLQQLESRTTDNDTPNDTRHNPRTCHYTEYCWTHGACNHKSAECRNKAEGHKDEATKNNRMGGSTNFISRLSRSKIKNGPSVQLPDSSETTSDEDGYLPIPDQLSDVAKHAYIFEGITNSTLISVGKLCDDGCEVTFTRDIALITKNGEILLTGDQNPIDSLWDIHLPLQQGKINAVISSNKTKTELAQFLHATCGFPVVSTFRTSISNGNFIGFPGIDSVSFTKHLPPSVPTAKGHLKQERQGLRSTKPVKIKLESDTECYFPAPIKEKTYERYACLSTIDKSQTAYGDLTGRYPIQSSRGNEYVLIVYDYDSNAILQAPLKNHQAATIKEAWINLHDRLKSSAKPPKTYIMDNEASKDLKHALTKANHFLAILAGTHPDFPAHEWDRLLDQAEITLNLLRNSRANPKLSSYAYLFGNFDFNKTPMVPCGTKVVAHIKPDKNASWGFKGEEGWYIGPATEHYRCLKCYFPVTCSVRVVDTVQLFEHNVPIPSTSTEDHLLQSVEDILSLLQKKSPELPFLQFGSNTHNAIESIAKLLQRAASRPSTPEISSSTDTSTTSPSKVEASSSPSSVEPPASPPAVESPVIPTLIPSPSIVESPVPSPSTVESPKSPPAVEQPSTIDKNAAVPRVKTYKKKKASKKQRKSPRFSNKQYPKCTFSSPHSENYGIPTYNVPTPKGAPKRNLRKNPKPSFKRATQSRAETYTTTYSSARGTNYRRHAIQHLRAELLFSQHSINHIFDSSGKKQSIDMLLKTDPETWKRSTSNEFGRLAQGVRDIKGTNTIEFIQKSDVPMNKKVAYCNMICDYRPLKTEAHRVRMTVGGDVLPYDDDAGSPAASLLETKLIVDSTISDAHKGARFCTADLKDHFLATPMEGNEYMRVHSKYFFADIRERYNIDELIADDGYVYIKIKKGMYGLKHAALLAYKHLVNILEPFGYYPCPYTTGLWKHKTRKTVFCLCVDDFGIKYFSEDDRDHLLDALKSNYKISTDLEGTHYCGLKLDWDYAKGIVEISMPDYVVQTLQRLCHSQPTRPQYAPHTWNKPVFGRKVQYANYDESPLLDAAGIKFVQSTVGSFLYYARAVDPTMLVALNEIGQQQAKPTEKTLQACKILLDYAATYPNTKIRYYASDMILHCDSDAAFLVSPNAKSQYAGYFYLGNKTSSSSTTKPNGAILVDCKTFRSVLASTAECETGGIFFNGQTAVVIRVALETLGHPQPPTPLKTDNSTANSFVHSNIKQRKSKTWDLCWHWLRDKEGQLQLKVYWDKGENNDGDYWTKHHAPSHHRQIRSRYVVNHSPSITAKLSSSFLYDTIYNALRAFPML